MISFNAIPIGGRVPGAYVEFDSSKAVSGLPAAPSKILLIGIRSAGGAVAQLVPTRIVNPAQAVQAFGRGSQLARMASALKKANERTEAWAIAVDENAAGTAATKTITITGPATAAGTLALMIGGTKVPVGVAAGDTATTIAAAIAAAVTAQPDLPVTAASALGVATLTARHKGAFGNDLDIRANYYQGESLPAGITCAVATGVSGTANADIAPALAAIADAAYQTIILPYTDAATLATIEAELLSRAGPLRMVEGLAFGAVSGTQGALATIGAARNSQFVSLLGFKSSPTPPAEIAAAYGGQIAFYGAIDPARPFQTIALPGVMAPAQQDRFTAVERELLLRDGISTYVIDAGGNVLIERAITTYQVNAQSLDDIAWLDVNTPLTLFYIRLAVRTRITSKFPRHKLASDGTKFGAGQAIVTPKILRGELIALFRDLEQAGLVENLDQFAADLIVERDGTDPNRVNALIPPDLVNQFLVFAGRVEFRL